MKKLLAVLLLFFLYFAISIPSFAQSDQIPTANTQFEGRVVKVLSESEQDLMTKIMITQNLKVRVLNGKMKNKLITLTTQDVSAGYLQSYKVGDTLLISQVSNNGTQTFRIVDYVRMTPLLILFAIFVLLAIIVGRKQGFTSLLGMGISLFALFKFAAPHILAGDDPLQVIVTVAVVLVPITFYLSHGISKKTTSAIIGTYVALFITIFLAKYFVSFARLTGFATDESAYLEGATAGSTDLQSLLLAGIVISMLGVLNDITVSQASIVYQLKKISPGLSLKELYLHAMKVGTDHIASAINTLVLVYAGASLPLLLLFSYGQPLTEVINYELVAEELVKSLLIVVGLILAVPITTFITAMLVSKNLIFWRKKDIKKQKIDRIFKNL